MPAVICPTDSGTAAKLMPSQAEERNKMAGNSYFGLLSSAEEILQNEAAEMLNKDASCFDVGECTYGMESS